MQLRRIPEPFERAHRALAQAGSAGPVTLEEVSAPGGLAPWAAALSARVSGGAVPAVIGTGRMALLYDASAPREWGGEFRIVTYIRSELEPEMAEEVLLGPVAWSWLTEALNRHHATVERVGGQTTRVLAESFGILAERPDTRDLELRASWTPILAAPEDVADHIDAWLDLLCTVAGLPPLPEGVSAFPGSNRP
jgi:hypothetical protein|nr:MULTISPECIES: DUF3000 family protein [unclassified Brevibacterium]